MGFLSVLSMAHKLAGERIRFGDCAVDATVGGGNDTLFLAQAVGTAGKVFGFDIQEEALRRAAERLGKEDGIADRVTLFAGSHDRMESLVPERYHGSVAAVMFNLGYLPGGDHSIITTATTTIPALEAALRLIRAGGIVAIVVYPGHPGGDAEAQAVEAWSRELPQAGYQVLVYRFANQRSLPPYLIAIEKK